MTVTTYNSRVYFKHTSFFSNSLLYSFFFCNLNGCDTIVSCILIYPRYLRDWIGKEMVNLSDASFSAQNLSILLVYSNPSTHWGLTGAACCFSVWEWELFGLIKEIDKCHLSAPGCLKSVDMYRASSDQICWFQYNK